jgi:hypothetical protein
MAHITQALMLQALKIPAGRDTGLASIFDRQRASQAMGFAAVAIAAAALVGADLPQLLGWGAGLPVMTPLVAACLAALGIAITRPGDPGLTLTAGIAVAAIAAVDLALAIAGGGLRIGPDMTATTVSLMPTPTALCLVLAGSALVLSGSSALTSRRPFLPVSPSPSPCLSCLAI